MRHYTIYIILNCIAYFLAFLMIGFLIFPAALLVVVPLAIIFSTAGEAYLRLKHDEKLVSEPVNSISGYRVRIKHFKKIAEKAETLGFKENSISRLKTFFPSIHCQFKHEKEPVFLTISFIAEKFTIELMTLFEPNGSLTTCSSPGWRDLPPLPGDYIHMVATQDLEKLLSEHHKGIEFFTQNSFIVKDLTLEQFTDLYINTIKDVARNVMKMKLWPFRAAWWYTKEGRKMYKKSIQEQVQSGIITMR